GSARRRLRSADIRRHARPFVGPAAVLRAESRPIRRQGRGVKGKVPEKTPRARMCEPWIGPVARNNDRQVRVDFTPPPGGVLTRGAFQVPASGASASGASALFY